MARYLICLICCLLTLSGFAEEEKNLILSTPDQLAALTCEPSYLIGGLISPLGGQPALQQTDLFVRGAQNIALTRVYISPNMPCYFPKHESCQGEYDKKYLHQHLTEGYRGWQFFPHLRLQFIPNIINNLHLGDSESSRDYTIASGLILSILTHLRSCNPGALASSKLQIICDIWY